MGQTLSEPITEKHTSSGMDDRLFYAASGMQGWRISMEDAHATLLHIKANMTENTDPKPLPNEKRLSFFAVFDGHGGANIAQYSGSHLHLRITRDESFLKGDYANALKNGFLGLDVDLRNDPSYLNDPSGCTSVAAIITDDYRLFVGNAGDSRAIISTKGEAVPMSYDHKPQNQEEIKRIINAGGFVEFGRVNGNLALSRAIGDFEFKQNANLPAELQAVTANPDIMDVQLTEADEFMVMACDGIWDCLSNQDVVDFVRERIAEGLELGTIAEQMMDRCLASESDLGGVGCDNMTVIIVGLLMGQSKDAWYEKIRNRVRADREKAAEQQAANAAAKANGVASPTISEQSPLVVEALLASPASQKGDGDQESGSALANRNAEDVGDDDSRV